MRDGLERLARRLQGVADDCVVVRRGDKRRLELGRGQVDASVQHGVEEAGVARGVGVPGGGVVGDGLVCEEEATYRQGTDIRTESRRVYEQRIATFGNFRIEPIEPFQTTETIAIPAAAMHSFHSTHNSVHWRLLVSGEVSGWPPFSRGFPVVVHPGDVIVADEIGVTVVPSADLPRVYAAAKEQAQREEATRQRIKQGKTFEELLAEFGRI